MNNVKTYFVENVDDFLKPDDREILELTKTYKLYLTKNDEVMKVKGFDSEGKATYVKGLTILSVIAGEAEEEIFVYEDEPIGDDNDKIYYRIKEEKDRISLSTFRNGQRIEEWERLYNENGEIKEDTHRFSTINAEIKLEYRYNEHGKLIESILYDLDGTPERIDEFEYEDKKLKKIIVKLQGYEALYPSTRKEFFYENGKLKNEREYIYPEKLIRETLFEYKDDLISLRKEERYLPFRVSSYFKFTYNKDKKIIKEEFFKDENLIYTKNYIYDDKGRNITQELKDRGDTLQGMMEYRYRNLEIKKSRLNEFLKERFYLEFIDNGLVESEKGFTKSQNGDFEYELFYEYDNIGRIKRIHR